MELPLNHNEPTVMHIDLNSCFAIAEQQANPFLRGKPVVVAAYASANGCVLSPSYEAKRLGIRVGMQVRDAKLLCKEVFVLTPDPPKYRDIHTKFCKIFRDYSPCVTPKSIDEAVLDFAGTPALRRGLVNIGKEIKQRIREEIGEWITCNIGISTNRFLAKLAASFHKPDGLDVITYKNLRQVYESVSLTDLNGINVNYQARLNAWRIMNPIEFLQAPLDLLQKCVFKSICGYYWYLRIRGWEIDAIDFSRKSYGQSYALKKPTDDMRELAPMLTKLCEKMGRRLRRARYKAQGVHVSCIYKDMSSWHRGKMVHTPLYSTQDLYQKTLLVFNSQPEKKVITNLAVSCYSLIPAEAEQLDIFGNEAMKKRNLTEAVDRINDKYGEFVITPARMMGMRDLIIDRISFGGVKDLEDLYGEKTMNV
jgi:DNA polymerase-4